MISTQFVDRDNQRKSNERTKKHLIFFFFDLFRLENQSVTFESFPRFLKSD